MGLLSGIGSLIDKYLVGYALGTASGPALRPFVQDLANAAWSANQHLPPPFVLLAEGVAAGQLDEGTARTWAHQQGISDGAFSALVRVADTGPGASYAFELWRRGLIGEGAFRRALKRMHLEEEWIDNLVGLKEHLLSPAELANARQQGFVDEGRQHAEAALQGIDTERADIQFQLSGLPPGVDVGQRAANRNLIDQATFAQIVREGHTKTKYTDLLWAMRHPILTVYEAAGLWLRGWIGEQEAYDLGALSGYTPEQVRHVYQNRGRPIAPVQAFTAFFRGAPGPFGGTFDKADFLQALKRSDIRTEYGETLWALRFAYPSLFQLRRAVQDGSILPARARVIMRYQRYEEQDADGLIASWTKDTAEASKTLTKAELLAEYEGLYMSEGDFRTGLANLGYVGATQDLEVHLGNARRVKGQRDKAVELIRKLYVRHDIDDAEATSDLGSLGVTGDAIALMLPIWQLERRITHKELSAAQVKRAYKKTLLTREQAIEALEDQGYTTADANVYLDS